MSMENPHEIVAGITPETATAGELFELGLIFCKGAGNNPDYITAHKWFNLAALKGSEEAKLCRSELSREMTASQVHEAQRQARAWLTMH